MSGTERLTGAAALDRADVPLGEVRHVFTDERDEPTWAAVRVDLLGTEVLVPLEDAAWDRDALHLAVAESAVLGAPPVHGAEAPTAREQERLYTHYGIPTVRHPRQENALLTGEPAEVSYSVREPAVRLAS